MNKANIITLVIAVIGAVTGTLSFTIQMYEKWESRPRLLVEQQGIYDLMPESNTPRYVLVVTYENLGNSTVTLRRVPSLRVKSQRSTLSREFEINPVDWSERQDISIPPHTRIQTSYSLDDLVKLYTTGEWSELRESPQSIQFRLIVETNAGTFESDLGRGIGPVDAEARMLLRRLSKGSSQ